MSIGCLTKCSKIKTKSVLNKKKLVFTNFKLYLKCIWITKLLIQVLSDTLARINLNMQMLKADSVISVTITMQTNTHFQHVTNYFLYHKQQENYNLRSHSLCELLKFPFLMKLEMPFASRRAFVAMTKNNIHQGVRLRPHAALELQCVNLHEYTWTNKNYLSGISHLVI